jgi:tetratricopeptide (TPR) repeat protein
VIDERLPGADAADAANGADVSSQDGTPRVPEETPVDRPLRLAATPSQESEHPSLAALQGFLAADLPRDEMRRTMAHLLRGCPACGEATRRLWHLAPGRTARRSPLAGPASSPHSHGQTPRTQGDELPSVPAADREYDVALERAFARAAQQQAEVDGGRQRARDLLDELMQHPPARQRLLVNNSARFRDPMLCESLLAASHDSGFRDPARSQQLAQLAIEVIKPGHLDEVEVAVGEPEGALDVDSAFVLGLRARAWAQLGNARRIGADLEGAAQAFAVAAVVLGSSAKIAPLDIARVLDLEASLLKDRRDLIQATSLLDRVIGIYRRLGQPSLLGHALNQKALVLAEAGDNQGSMTLLRRALELLDPQEEPRRFLAARHNLICALLADGQPREAFAMLFHTRPLYLKTGDRLNLLRLRWLEGSIALALDRLEQAEAAFREVREAFVELGVAYDAALVSLDLAAVLARQGRTAEMRQLAEEMLTFFTSRQIHREAMAALLVFCEAARLESAGVGVVEQVATFLKQARNAPDLRFSPAP